MTLHNIKTMRKDRGFTIVELLIVIVVIAILAAITIVAYNGIQNRSKLSSAQSTENIVAKKAEAWNAIQSSYPSYCQLATNTLAPTGAGTGVGAAGCVAAGGNGPAEAKLDDPSLIAVNATSVTPANGVNTVFYAPCSTTGARISYYHYTNGAITSATTTPASPTVGTGC
jgi:prepilin-type N-terminal cleavage/methylation domain-containing protein